MFHVLFKWSSERMSSSSKNGKFERVHIMSSSNKWEVGEVAYLLSKIMKFYIRDLLHFVVTFNLKSCGLEVFFLC